MYKRLSVLITFLAVLIGITMLSGRGEYWGLFLSPVLAFFLFLFLLPNFEKLILPGFGLFFIYLVFKVSSSELRFEWFLYQGIVTSATACGLLVLKAYWEGDLAGMRVRAQKAGEKVVELRRLEKRSIDQQEKFEEEVNDIVSLFELAREFNECIDLREIVNVLSKQVFEHIPFERGKLIFLDEGIIPIGTDESQMLGVGKIEQADETAVREMAFDQEIVSRLVKLQGITHIDKLEDDSAGLLKGHSIRFPLWIFPLVVGGEITAALWVEGGRKDDFNKFEIIASQLALHVKKVKLYNRVKELSLADGLTKLFVRRHFLDRFRDELTRSLKYRLSLVVLMLDIDHFKEYNDTYGHMVGDVALKQVAQTIKEEIRKVDVAARYGGEEFAVILPETDRKGGLDAAERIRSRVAKRVFRAYDEDTRLTVSIGITVFPDDVPGSSEENPSEDLSLLLLKQADQALYRAKEEGRNHIVSFRA